MENKNLQLLLKYTDSSFKILKQFLGQKNLILSNEFFYVDKKLLHTYFHIAFKFKPEIKKLYDFDKNVFNYFLSKSLINSILAIYVIFLNNDIKLFDTFINSTFDITKKTINGVQIRDFSNLLNETKINIHDKDMIEQFNLFFDQNKDLNIIKFEKDINFNKDFFENQKFNDVIYNMFTIGLLFSITINMYSLIKQKFIILNA